MGVAPDHITAEQYFQSSRQSDRTIASMPIDVVISEHDVYGPDVLWFRQERVPSNWEAERQGIPDLAVEIRSPGTWRFDTGRKRDAYEAGGLPELWLVDPHPEVVNAQRRSAAGVEAFDVELGVAPEEELTSPLLPGFSLDPARLFARS